MDSVLKKQAAEAIRLLQEENAALREKVAHLNAVQNLLFTFYKQGNVSAENLEPFYLDLLDKSALDLEVLEKAAEYNGFSKGFTFGSLSDRLQDDGTLDPLTRCLIEDL